MNQLTIRKALNKAFLKVKPSRENIDDFKNALNQFLQQINPAETEEYNKNLLSAFLKATVSKSEHFINTKGRTDLVIHQGKNAKTPVAVMIEVKRPNNKTEMPDLEKGLNAKAFQELVLYYLRERIDNNNLAIKKLIITDTLQWFIFDATEFEKHFANDKALVKQFKAFSEEKLASAKTDFFYKNIAKAAIEKVQSEIAFTHFDLNEYRKIAANAAPDKTKDKKLIPLFKTLSPEHLLKLKFANDSNTLDKKFYAELLHIIGLHEVGKTKKTIERLPEGKRNNGSLLETTIAKLQNTNRVRKLANVKQYGDTHEAQTQEVALQLVITWVNRILFLKLLEAQLLSYHDGDKAYAFLSFERLPQYDEVASLFFEVLAIPTEQRSDFNKKCFPNVPYLNSSLFEETELEERTINIDRLRDIFKLPILSNTVLKDHNGKRQTGELHTLEYLFGFLDAYDFASEGTEDIQEQAKTIINASVLGLIFEKINGYKDGSFFTPGFITMYMCRETLRRAVIQKFNETNGWNCQTFEDLKEDIQQTVRQSTAGRSHARLAANDIINSLKICDPAVGSGHFLVSALNEMIAIKYELGVFQDENGKTFRDYDVRVENDELIVWDEEEDRLFQYNPTSKESLRIQKTLFQEKQTIIENCLFGVDINPNSVKICRLRLWIELLKNAFYTEKTYKVSENLIGLKYQALETLPNIDINIQCGNSLISRFGLDTNLKDVLKEAKKKHNITIQQYKNAFQQYRQTNDKAVKQEMTELIRKVKTTFRTTIARNSKENRQLARLSQDFYYKYESTSLFDAKLTKKQEKDKATLKQKIDKLKTTIDEIENNQIYQNAFEWRFEFPEVLDDNGDFIGFDVVIGNPPYIRQEEFKEIKDYLKKEFQTFAGTADLLVYFIERGLNIARPKARFTYIISNKFMRASFGKALRQWLAQYNLTELLDFGDLPVFEEATTYPCVLSLQKTTPTETFNAATLQKLPKEGFEKYIESIQFESMQAYLTVDSWNLANKATQLLLEKLKNQGTPLGEYVNGRIFRGVMTGYSKGFVIDEETKEKLLEQDPNSSNVLKPFVAGRDIKKYSHPNVYKYLILFPKGWTKEMFGNISEDDALKKLKKRYPAIVNFLIQHKERAKKRTDKGDFWWELRACDYYNEFEIPKIVYQVFQVSPCFIFDKKGLYGNNSIWIIPNANKTILSILNSKLGWFLISSFCTQIKNGYQLIYDYFSKIPIVKERSSEIEEKVQTILSKKQTDPKADTSEEEAEIDRLIYALYGLTAEEIAIVEG